MLPTPSTSHVCFDTIYEPAEDSYLFLDTLSSASESAWLRKRFTHNPAGGISSSPLVVEVGTGSGVVLAFVAANAAHIFGRADVLTLGTDVNSDACIAARKTVRTAINERKQEGSPEHEAQNMPAPDRAQSNLLATMTADLCSPFRSGSIDVLIFNPPYVPTPEVPHMPSTTESTSSSKFERDSHLLSLSYAGGDLGMETTNRLLSLIPDILDPQRGVAYILLCAQNKPEDVKAGIRDWGSGWMVETVGSSGMKAGWERLVIIRIWREATS